MKLKDQPLPASINVFGTRYRVKKFDNLKDKADNELWGQCDFDKKVLEIDNSPKGLKMWQTFFHELYHAALEETGMGEPLSDELIEQLSEMTSKLMVKIFK